MVSGFTTRFIAMWLIDNHGLGMGVFVSTVLNCIGGWIRFWPGSDDFAWLFAGQTFCAVAQGFIDIAGPKIAANWFPPKERTTATAFAQGPIFLAALLCYSIAPRAVKSGADMAGYNLLQALLMTGATALIFALFRGKPPIPPSARYIYIPIPPRSASWISVFAIFCLCFLFFSLF
jgi:sugar phosphate permease